MEAARHKMRPKRQDNTLPTAILPTSTGDGAVLPTVILPSSTGDGTAGTPSTVIFDTKPNPSALTTPTPAVATSTTATVTPTTTTTSTTTPTAAAKPEKANTGVLIPAIVAPIAVVLLIAFAVFWWLMRRRARKAQAKEPEFVMEKRRHPRKHSRDDSTHSNSSTRKLVSKASHGDGVNKEAGSMAKEMQRSSLDLFHDTRETPGGLGIGVAQSPENTPSHSRQNSTEAQHASGRATKAPAVRNFSRGPGRPSTANQDRDHGVSPYGRDRSMSTLGSRPPPPPPSAGWADTRDSPYGRPPPSMAERPDPRRAPPTLRGPPPVAPPKSSAREPASAQSHLTGSRPAPRPAQVAGMSPERSRPEPSRSKAIHPPAAIETRTDDTVPKGTALSPPTPTGAYNGASPISQYSPIIKSQTKLGTSPPDGFTILDGPLSSKDSPSTPAGSAFTEENMRIARLADSSRLGFYKDTATHPKHTPTIIATAAGEDAAVDQPNPAPRLPPPATREMPPLNFPPPPPPPVDSPTMPSSNSRRADSFVNDRRSMRSVRSVVSRLSDDEYVDMEVDAKSDVSSLDERERWDMERETRNRGTSRSRAAGGNGNGHGRTAGGYGGLGTSSAARPPLTQNPGGSGTTNGSQYSLGRY